MRTTVACILSAIAGIVAGYAWADAGIGVRCGDADGLSAEGSGYQTDIPFGCITGIASDAGRGISLYKNFTTEYARFAMARVSEDTGKGSIQPIWIRKEGASLNGDARIERAVPAGESNGGALENFQEALDELKRELESLSENLEKIPESEEYRRLKLKWERLVEELKRSGKAAKEKLENEVLPLLQRELEELKQKLMKRKKEEAPEPLRV